MSKARGQPRACLSVMQVERGRLVRSNRASRPIAETVAGRDGQRLRARRPRSEARGYRTSAVLFALVLFAKGAHLPKHLFTGDTLMAVCILDRGVQLRLFLRRQVDTFLVFIVRHPN